jgi:hypothetical protein
MERSGPPVRQYAVHFFTPSFQFSGQLEIIGNLLDFLNDTRRDVLICQQVRIVPLKPGLRELTRPSISIRKTEFVLLYFDDPSAQSEMRLLTRAETTVIYTDLAIVRGDVHLPAEARANDFLAAVSGILLPVTSVSLFKVVEFPLPFPDHCDLLLVGRDYIQMYHPV